jgi:predicted TPR repeat methyltransferase
MKKSSLAVSRAQTLHKKGLFDEAKTAYLKILKTDPHEVEALHALGILSAQIGDFAAAANYLRSAIELQPQNHTLYLNLANALKTLGQFDEAVEVLQKAISIHPDYSAALNNLGTVYFAQSNLPDAIYYYNLATQKRPDYIDAYYNLGLALTRQNDSDAAISAYEKIIILAPQHAAAHFQLGCLLLAKGKTAAAEKHFLLIEQDHPHHFETQVNLANCYIKQGALRQAKIHYLKALELAPEDTDILFNLGVINMQLGKIDEAIQNYSLAIQINPDYFAAHNNLGVAFLTKQYPDYALPHFREALRLQPQNKAINHTVLMLSQDERLHDSPPEYIKNLFDTYADHYDAHLLQTLAYKVPEHFLQAVKTVLKDTTVKLDILDLGCGTGLCAPAFKPLAKTLTGVDLSEKMLEIAAQKNLYDELVLADAVEYLAEKKSAFDLIISGDVFIYVGALEGIFQHGSAALRPRGLLVFNTEITENANYLINQSGRFAHHKKYLEQLAEQHGLKVAHYQNVITRQQNNVPVYGHFYVLQKESQT